MTDTLTRLPSAAAQPGAWFDSLAVLALQPGRLIELLDRQFEMISPFDDLGAPCDNGLCMREPWRPGVVGVVCGVEFNTCKGWEVRLEHEGDWHALNLEMDQVWINVPVAEFLRHTRPLAPYDSDFNRRHTPREAANDE